MAIWDIPVSPVRRRGKVTQHENTYLLTDQDALFESRDLWGCYIPETLSLCDNIQDFISNKSRVTIHHISPTVMVRTEMTLIAVLCPICLFQVGRTS